MAGSLNKASLIGNLGADPEIKTMSSGSKFCNLRLATSETWKDKQSGERKEKTEWHRIVIWNEGLVKVAEQYLKKGAKIYVEGQIETRKWQKDGVDQYSTEIVLKAFNGVLTMLDSRKDGDIGSGSEPKTESKPAANPDDDIPF